MYQHSTAPRVITAQTTPADGERVLADSRTAPNRTDFCARRIGCTGPFCGGWYDLDRYVS